MPVPGGPAHEVDGGGGSGGIVARPVDPPDGDNTGAPGGVAPPAQGEGYFGAEAAQPDRKHLGDVGSMVFDADAVANRIDLMESSLYADGLDPDAYPGLRIAFSHLNGLKGQDVGIDKLYGAWQEFGKARLSDDEDERLAAGRMQDVMADFIITSGPSVLKPLNGGAVDPDAVHMMWGHLTAPAADGPSAGFVDAGVASMDGAYGPGGYV